MIATYNAALAQLDGADETRLDAQTVLRKRPGGSVIVTHNDADLVTFTPEGKVTITTEGNLTTSARNRINRYSPFAITSDRGVWWADLNPETGARAPLGRVVYEDGLHITDPIAPGAQVVLLGGKAAGYADMMRDRRSRVLDYARSLISSAQVGRMEAPTKMNALDPWTALQIPDGRLLVEVLPSDRRTSIIYNHVRYARFSPHLLARVAQDSGDPVAVAALDALWTPNSPHPRAGRFDDVWATLTIHLRKFLLRQLALVQ